MERIEQAVILAAGEGQRLRPFTSSKPKVMIPIANKPILRYVIEAVVKNGIRKIIVVVGYRKDQVMDYFGAGENFDAEIDYVEQKQQLGTAHALKQVEPKVNGRFLALSGDNIPEEVLKSIRHRSPLSLVRQSIVPPKRYCSLTIGVSTSTTSIGCVFSHSKKASTAFSAWSICTFEYSLVSVSSPRR